MNDQVLNVVAQTLQEKFGFATQTQLDRAVSEILRKTEEKSASGPQFSLSRMFRGLRAVQNVPLPQPPGYANTAETDAAYVKALTTGATPGSYLVPTIQAEEIIGYLTIGGIARSAGVRVWPCSGIQKLTVPVATAAPSWVWTSQNSAQTATDPNLSQMAFDLKERRCLTAVPNQLIAVSVPAFDTLLAELIGLGAAEHEDTAFFATTTVAGGPTALFAAASITTVNCGGSANGGNLSYSDIVSVLASMAAQKGKGPFCWFMSPRTFYTRVLGLVDSSSRPLVIPTLSQGLYDGIRYALMGYPVFVTPAIPENETLGSGTNQSHIVFTNPRYLHIAQDSNIEFAVSLERYFDLGQTAIRGIQHEDFGFAPPQGVVVLRGIN